MKRTPFLFLAALSAGVPLAFAFSPCCDHKGNCKHKQAASVAATGQTPAMGVAGVSPSAVSAPLTRVAPTPAVQSATCGQSKSSCTVAPSVTTLVPGQAAGATPSVQVFGVRPSKASKASGGAAGIAVPSVVVHTPSGAQGQGGASSCTVTSGSVGAGSNVVTVSPRGQSSARVLRGSSHGNGVTVLTTEDEQELEHLSESLSELQTLDTVTLEGRLQLLRSGEAALIAAQSCDPQASAQIKQKHEEALERLHTAQVQIRDAQEAMRKMQVEQREAELESRRDMESALREAREERAAETRESQEALREHYSTRSDAQRKVAAAKRDAELAERYAATAKEQSKLARKYAGKDAEVALLRKAEAQGAKDKRAKESEAKLYKKLYEAGGAGGVDRTRELERRIAELERELAELRAQRGVRGRAPTASTLRKFRIDPSGEKTELFEIAPEADEDNDDKDADHDQRGGQSFWETFDQKSEGGGGFSAFAPTPRIPMPPMASTAPLPPMPPIAPMAPQAAPPAMSGMPGEAPDAPPAPPSLWQPMAGMSPAPAAIPPTPPTSPGHGFDVATEWYDSATRVSPPQPMPGGGELEDAMRELRDEIRALRDSMQGLRERIHSMSDDGTR